MPGKNSSQGRPSKKTKKNEEPAVDASEDTTFFTNSTIPAVFNLKSVKKETNPSLALATAAASVDNSYNYRQTSDELNASSSSSLASSDDNVVHADEDPHGESSFIDPIPLLMREPLVIPKDYEPETSEIELFIRLKDSPEHTALFHKGLYLWHVCCVYNAIASSNVLLKIEKYQLTWSLFNEMLNDLPNGKLLFFFSFLSFSLSLCLPLFLPPLPRSCLLIFPLLFQMKDGKKNYSPFSLILHGLRAILLMFIT
jgi:hypothetical protein